MDWMNIKNLFPPGFVPSRTDTREVSTLALPSAIEKADLHVIKDLLNHGADPNKEDLFGVCTMSKALILPDSENKRKILIELLLYGGNITKKVISDANFWKGGSKK